MKQSSGLGCNKSRRPCADDSLPVSCCSSSTSCQDIQPCRTNGALCPPDYRHLTSTDVGSTGKKSMRACVYGHLCTCSGLKDTEVRAGRAARSCDGLRPCRKVNPRTGRRWASSASLSALMEEGAFSSVLFSNKLEVWKKESM